VILCPAWKQAIDGDPKVWGEKYKAEMALALKEAGVTKGEQIKAGLAEFRRKGKPFLPGPGEFAQMCSGSQATGLTHNTAAYKFFDRMDEQKRLPKPSRPKNETAKILSGIKAKLK